jgi:Holliday junction resolvasome RuvABC endonuclease subunit
LETQRYAVVARALVNGVLSVVGTPSQTTVWIEQYTFSQDSSSLSALYEITGVVQDLLVMSGYHFWKLSNKTAKRVFGGSGETDKTGMFLACRRQFPTISRLLEQHFMWSVDAALSRSAVARARNAEKKKEVGGDADEDGEDNTLLGSYVSGGEEEHDENGASTTHATVRSVHVSSTTKKNKSKSKLIPHPVEDLVDALAVAWVGMIQTEPPKTKESVMAEARANKSNKRRKR